MKFLQNLLSINWYRYSNEYYSSRRNIFFKFLRPRTNKIVQRYNTIIGNELQIIPNCPRFLLQPRLIVKTEKDRLSDLLPWVDYPSETTIYDRNRFRHLEDLFRDRFDRGPISAIKEGGRGVIFFSSGLRMFNQITVYWRYPWTPILDSRTWKINEGLLWKAEWKIFSLCFPSNFLFFGSSFLPFLVVSLLIVAGSIIEIGEFFLFFLRNLSIPLLLFENSLRICWLFALQLARA